MIFLSHGIWNGIYTHKIKIWLKFTKIKKKPKVEAIVET